MADDLPTGSGPAPPTRTRAALQLVGLVAGLGLVFLALSELDLLSIDRVQAAVEPLGPAAPLGFAILAGLASALFLPGPVIAVAAGVLFGLVLGSVVATVGAVAGALCALLVGRRAGAGAVDRLAGPRLQRLTADLAGDGGLGAVVALRLAPGVPDAPGSYAAGALGVRARPMALGTLIGAAPRSIAYAALGSTADDVASTVGAVAGVAVVLVNVLGVEVVRRQLLHERDAVRAPDAGAGRSSDDRDAGRGTAAGDDGPSDDGSAQSIGTR